MNKVKEIQALFKIPGGKATSVMLHISSLRIKSKNRVFPADTVVTVQP